MNDPRVLSGVVNLPVPGDVGVPQGTPGLCFGDRHDLLPPGLFSFARVRPSWGWGPQTPPLLICAEAMIAGVDPDVDRADQETEAAAVAESLATRNLPPSGRQLEPQAPQAREPWGDRSAGIRSGDTGGGILTAGSHPSANRQQRRVPRGVLRLSIHCGHLRLGRTRSRSSIARHVRRCS